MLDGRIFKKNTGRNIDECATVIDVWDAIKAAGPVRTFEGDRYISNLVPNRGGIFDHKHYDDDVDSCLASL